MRYDFPNNPRAFPPARSPRETRAPFAVGSIEATTQPMWVLDGESKRVVRRPTTFASDGVSLFAKIKRVFSLSFRDDARLVRACETR